MTANNIVDAVRDSIAEARSKAEMVSARSQGVVQAGSQTLRAAKGVVAQAGREVAGVLAHTRDELKRTLKEGAAQMGDRLSHITTPTRKDEAMARKLEVKAKKRQKREARMEGAEQTGA